MGDSKLETRSTSRRAFLGRGALAAVGIPAAVSFLESCAPKPKPAAAVAAPPVKTPQQQADEMDALTEAGIKAFPAATAGRGCQPLAPKIVGGVKVFELTCREIEWEVTAGQKSHALAYNDQVPGPMIRVTEGDRVRVILHNRLSESTSIHFHGLEIPNDQDGVPYITQPPVKAGADYTYEFTAPNSGSHMYHSHHNAVMQVPMGLLGPFIIDPRDRSREPKVDVDHVIVLNDGPHGFTLNGKGFPATEPIVAKRGQTVRIRYMNEGMMIHPMHLHGMHMTVIAKDGWPQPQPWKCDTLNIAPGERWDVLVHATNPGVWAFHCHILQHAEGMKGMFGMVTALIVK